jgi:hypothetical protein
MANSRTSRNNRKRKTVPSRNVVSLPQKAIEQYDHFGKTRLNNPQVGLVTPETEPAKTDTKRYAYDPHLDPHLMWAGKTEHTSFEVPTVSLHVHERIDPRTIIEAVRARSAHEIQPSPPSQRVQSAHRQAAALASRFLGRRCMTLPSYLAVNVKRNGIV